MIKSNVVLIALSLSFFFLTHTAAEGTVFFLARPYIASVSIDGVPAEKTTPFVVSSMTEGSHRATFASPGFETVTVDFSVESSTATVVSVDLEATSVNLAFPGFQSLQVHDDVIPLENSFISVTQGQYEMSRDGEVLSILPVYPREGLIKSLNLSSALVFSLGGILAAGALIDPPSSGRSLPIAVTTSHITGALLLAASAVVNADKSRYLDSYPALVRGDAENVLDKDRYERGEKFLSEGRMDDAMDEFSQVIASALPSLYYPRALYQQARISRLRGDGDSARAGFLEIVTDHPIPELYDKCLKGLADLAYADRDYSQSLSRLESMVFIDPLYSREEIDSYVAEILSQQFEAGVVPADQVLQKYSAMLDDYPESAQADYYRVKSALYFAHTGNFAAARQMLGLINSDGVYANEIMAVQQLMGSES